MSLEDLRKFPENGWSLFALQQNQLVQIPEHGTLDLQYRFAAQIQEAQDTWQRFTIASSTRP